MDASGAPDTRTALLRARHTRPGRGPGWTFTCPRATVMAKVGDWAPSRGQGVACPSQPPPHTPPLQSVWHTHPCAHSPSPHMPALNPTPQHSGPHSGHAQHGSCRGTAPHTPGATHPPAVIPHCHRHACHTCCGLPSARPDSGTGLGLGRQEGGGSGPHGAAGRSGRAPSHLVPALFSGRGCSHRGHCPVLGSKFCPVGPLAQPEAPRPPWTGGQMG